MKPFLIIASFFIFLAVNGCDTTEPNDIAVHPVEEYYPLKINNKWEYAYSSSALSAVVEKTIKNNVTHEDGSNIWGYTDAVKVNDPEPDNPIAGYNTIRNGCLYFYSLDRDTLESGTLCRKDILLKDPVKVGTTWEVSPGINGKIEKIYDTEVLGEKYRNSVLVVTEFNDGVDSSWYSLNVGLIKRVNHNSMTQEYHSFLRYELRKYTLN